MKINYNDIIKKNNLPAVGSKIVVAMSGGVDSSVTATILHHAGYDVIGVTMQLYQSKLSSNSKTCCSGRDISDARKVAKKLGFKHFIIDYQKEFEKSVIDNFVNSYKSGQTPIPCIKCNQTVKFRDLLNFTHSMNCNYLATGHYVKRVEKNGKINLFQAKDKKKDQSYFLFATTQKQLKTLRFPLGDFTKEEIRKYAMYHKLNVSDKPDSQDICFIPDGDYSSFINKRLNNKVANGVIENYDGTILGKHIGITEYTIGQRKKIGIGGISGNKKHTPLYVLKIDSKTNKIIVGPKEKLASYNIYFKDLNLFTKTKNNKTFEAYVKIRSGYKKKLGKVNISKKNDSVGFVNLYEPEFGVAPGQACVFYTKSKMLIGGGWITAGELISSDNKN